MPNQSKYSFIANEPIGEDLFKNKSQSKIAEVIRNTVIDDHKFQIIGIDGEWGVGKSNLVRLLSSQLNHNYIFFTYDVWGHQEDDQRRSILVELTDHLSEKKVLKNKSKWEERLRKLLGKEREVTTINRPYLGLGIIFTIFAILYTPMITMFKDVIGDEYFGINLGENIWKTIILFIPLVLLFITYLSHFVSALNNKESWKSFSTAFYRTYQIYSNKQIDETKIETISEKNPSVKDFTSWINDINKDLVDRKLIIVFDNFDRLPKKHIINLWSSIHIFFAEKIDQKSNNNIKVLLPFDRAHILHAFSDLNVTGDKDNTRNYADDYINKTFDIIFRVSLPLLSDWKTFFADKWKLAFTQENNQSDYLKVLEIYEFLNQKITPREIIAFINDIVSIKLLDEEYELPYIAIFSLCKDNILQDPLKALVELTYLGGLEEQYKNDDKFSKQITAIVYQIKPDENAVELIYTHQLKDALQNQHITIMNNICKTDFANHIIQRVINELTVPSKAIESFSKLSQDSSLTGNIIQSVWDRLYFKTYQHAPQDFGIDHYQYLLLDNCSSQLQYVKILINNMQNHGEFSAISYARIIENLNERQPSLDIFNILEKVEIDVNSFLDLLDEYPDYKKFKLFTTDDHLDSNLAKKDFKTILDVNTTAILVKDFELNEYRKSLLDMYSSFAENTDYENTNLVLHKLKEFREFGKSSDEVTYLKDYAIYNLLANSDQQDSFSKHLMYDLMAMALVSYEEIALSYKANIERYFNDLSEKEVEEIAKSILYYISFGNLLLKYKILDSLEVFHKVIVYLVHNDLPLIKELDINTILPQYDTLGDKLKIDGVNIEVIEKYNNIPLNLHSSDIPVNLIETCYGDYPDLEISKQIIEQLGNYYLDLDIDGWKNLFTDEQDPFFSKFHFVCETFNNNAFVAWSEIFKKKLINKESLSDQFSWILEYAINKKEELAFGDFLKGIKNAIYKDLIDVDKYVFNVFYPLFKEYKVFEEDSLEVFRTVFKPSNLGDDNILDVIIEDLEYLKILYNIASDNNKKSFKLFIRENANGNEKLELISKALNISVKRKAKEKE